MVEDSQPNDDPRLWANAYHEAGHAVLSWQLGRRFREVSAEPNQVEGSLGRVLNRRRRKWLRSGVEDDALIYLAGPEAERRYLRRDDWGGASPGDDLHQTLKLLSLIDADPFHISNSMQRMEVSVRERLQRRELWAAVEALAAALVKRGRLKGREARQLIEAVHLIEGAWPSRPSPSHPQ